MTRLLCCSWRSFASPVRDYQCFGIINDSYVSRYVAGTLLAVTSSNCFPQAQSDPVLGTGSLVQPMP